MSVDVEGTIHSMLPWMRSTASRLLLGRQIQCVDADDLVAEGMIEVWKASKRFDPSRGVTFKTFASRSVPHRMVDAIRNASHLSRSAVFRQASRSDAIERFTQREGRPPAGDECDNLSAPSVLTLDGFDQVAAERVVDRRANGIDAIEHRDSFERLLCELPAGRHRDVMRYYFVDDLTMKEIGRRMNISETYVCMIIAEAKRILSASLANQCPRLGSNQQPAL